MLPWLVVDAMVGLLGCHYHTDRRTRQLACWVKTRSSVRQETYVNVYQRFAASVQRRRELALVDDVPYVDFVRRVVRCACGMSSAFGSLYEVHRGGRTSGQPLSVWAVTHRVPCYFVDGVGEAICGLQLAFQDRRLGRRVER